ncbi:MAG: UDP-N-acetylmuramoyl-L-alanine--D-glutamate ligase [Pseudobdellovibrionaceae bacterium]
MSDFIKNLPQPIGIVGLGKSGESAYKLLSLFFSKEQLFTFDSKNPSANFTDSGLFVQTVQPKTLVVSPGVPLSTDWIQNCKKSGVLITSEISLAASILTTEKTIGITGSLGKSTTVSLLNAALEKTQLSYFVGGNIGIPFADYAIEIVQKKRRPADWVVLELSSYQLENAFGLKLNFSAITYLAANHLERYSSLDEYYHTKWKILDITQEKCFMNFYGGDLASFINEQSRTGIAKEKAKKIFFAKKEDLTKYELQENRLVGSHNIDNLALATQMALSADWGEACIAGLKCYPGMAHRLENIGEHDGVLFINDSKATTIESVLSAISATAEIPGRNTIHLLLGGKDKSLPWHKLSDLKLNPRIQFYFFGADRQLIQSSSQLAGPVLIDFKSALDECRKNLKPKDVVLLSPGGTSLDEFKNFEERGEVFRQYVLAKN